MSEFGDRYIVKDPQALLDYKFDWAPWLLSLGDADTISASTWTPPAGITVNTSSFTGLITTVWLSGGSVGANYDVVNHITTVAGRQTDRTLQVQVRQQ